MAPSILSAKQKEDLEAYLALNPMQDFGGSLADCLRGRWIFEDEGPDLIVMGYETAHVLTGCTREQWDAVMANAIDLDAEEEA